MKVLSSPSYHNSPLRLEYSWIKRKSLKANEKKMEFEWELVKKIFFFFLLYLSLSRPLCMEMCKRSTCSNLTGRFGQYNWYKHGFAGEGLWFMRGSRGLVGIGETRNLIAVKKRFPPPPSCFLPYRLICFWWGFPTNNRPQFGCYILPP